MRPGSDRAHAVVLAAITALALAGLVSVGRTEAFRHIVALPTLNPVHQDTDASSSVTATPTATAHPVATPVPPRHALVASATRARPKYLVLFVVDGGRPDYLTVPG